MSNKIKNVIFLTVDSMRYDRMQRNGYPIDTTPTIDWLRNKGISCANAVTHSHPTQFSFPSIFTSTLPLDFGGYDMGIKQRPITLAQVLETNGYKTVAFSTSIFLSRFFGYERGFNEFYEFFDIELFWKTIVGIYFKYFEGLKDKNTIEELEFGRITKSMLNDLLLCAVPFCERKRNELFFGKVAYDRRIYRHNFELLKELLLGRLSCLNTQSHEDLFDLLSQGSHKDLYVFAGMPKNATKKAMEFYFNIIRKGLKAFSIQMRRPGSNISAEYLKNYITDWIGNNSSKPFFLWAHFLDAHDLSCITGKIGFPPGYMELYSSRIKLGRNYYGNLQYDFSLRYIDENVKSIVSFLKKKELLEKTLIVICSDHGAHNAGRPNRLFSQTPVGEGYEEVLKIPMIFHNVNLQQEVIYDLCTTLDIAPTILDLIGIDPVDEFKGHPVYSAKTKERIYIVCENLSSGPCDIARKPINIAVRTRQYKYIFREFSDCRETVPRALRELYDLCMDPEEKNNISGAKVHAEIEQELENIARQRCLEIRQGQVRDS
ncbi:MAG: sulfatase-like hydrolase/transferase [Candidatus Omnitrophica bacterium]|nr:sulfatase-like hydrolase/transferase [Candidatus Omnitrophota bacterium]MBU1127557.1 sulfatase-like hydrolase/transferase [Candidatus Omnitrophota bacterium]MBU1785316.1 sulfatase-like hydrolase/transferase [Candidatus Omnitrophota bacterium]MBU1852393.1 sulfatase-like hydrolase/transferase [Candidatus Omnitrophota bacterium]